jgi:acyl transferase domain-containing protein/NADPH:quinone reductase-like Zn-dependent oxidoreductase/acyl carrier protein
VNEPIAIIGIGCRFPGGANSPAAFWKLMLDGVDATGEIPPDRWDVDAYYHPNRNAPGKMHTRRGGFVSGLELFDAAFFGISPREACRVSPQQRLLLETAWEALEDAGLPVEHLAVKKTGVFIGISNEDYGETRLRDIGRIDAYTCTGSAMSIAANRISYCFNFDGPSLAVDTACSSSLVAAHLACQSLWRKESDVALVGGVNVLLTPERFVGFSKASMLSPDGRCYAFDARANGYVRAEGAGVVVLKPVAQAQADGDRIYAVILATAINQDGRTAGLSLPSGAAQETLLRDVYARAGVLPQAVQYVEMHGTGTPAGDPIEADAVGRVLGIDRGNADVCRIGSVKTNIGHLESGSGIAGLIKLALALKQGQIPASLHCETPNPQIDFRELQLRVQRETEAWPESGDGRIAGINSFGFGGTNAHAVLKDFASTPQEPAEPEERDRAYLLPISARSSETLDGLARRYRGLLLADGGRTKLGDLCSSAGLRRSHHDWRAALVARTTEEMVRQLDAFLGGERRLGVASGQVRAEKRPRLAFLFAGNGPQWWGMGRQLLESAPAFREAVAACGLALRKYTSWSLLEELERDEATSRLNRTEIAQPALFALQLGLVALWRSWGIVPDAVIGHSVGEIAAAHIAGILGFDDAVRVIFHRSRTQGQTAGKGAMAVVEMSADGIREMLASYGDRLSLAAVNAPTAVTVSGDGDALQDLLRKLDEENVFARQLRLNYAFHSRHMDPIQTELLQSLAELEPQPASVRMVSAVTGKDLRGTECGAPYWWDNIRKPVLFGAAIECLLEDGYSQFVEIGPHPVLASYVAECAARREEQVQILPSLRRKEHEWSTLLGTCGALHTAGFPVTWRTLHPGHSRYIDLPSYPWQRERHWQPLTRQPLSGGESAHPLLGRRLECPQPQWGVQLDPRIFSYLLDHHVQGRLLFPGTAYLEMGIAAAAEIFGQAPIGVGDYEILEAIDLEEAGPPALQLLVEADKSFGVYSRESESSDWRLRARGSLLKVAAANVDRSEAPDVIRQHLPLAISKDEIYRRSGLRHYQYGPLFQSLERVWVDGEEALGMVQAAALLEAETSEYFFHPAMLDALWQTFITLLPQEDEAARRTTWLPVKTGRYRFFGRPGKLAYAHVRRVRTATHDITFEASILDPRGTVLADFQGVRMRPLQDGRKSLAIEDWLYESTWQTQVLPGTNRSIAHEDWVVFTDSLGLGEELGARLEACGRRVIRVTDGATFERRDENHFVIVPGCVESARRLFQTLEMRHIVPAGIAYTWSVDIPPCDAIGATSSQTVQDGGCPDLIAILRALLTVSFSRLPRVWLLTRGAHSVESTEDRVSVFQAPIWGLGRVIMNEHPDLRCTVVDLSAPDDCGTFLPDELQSLLTELLANEREQEILLRGKARYVSRLIHSAVPGGKTKGRVDLTQAETFRLEIERPGVIDNLSLQIVPRRAPCPYEVEIEPYATGLNFKDVLQALSVLSGDALEQGYMGGLSLGLECAGRVTRKGAKVTDFAIGDEVVAFSRDSFAGHVVTRAEFVALKPRHMSFEAAATIPIAFFTAYHALHEVARLQPGERVLIHAASGGVGLAAVQIARQHCAEVFATAGSPQKRQYLQAIGIKRVMDSRSLGFADEILAQTGGEGVHVVLNSLTGEALLQGIRVLKPLGRFLEVGKRDILQNSKLGLKPFEKCLSFHTIDIDQLLLHEPTRSGKTFRDLLARFDAAVFQPLPFRAFGIDEVNNAFRFMQEARHIGKIVVSIKDVNVQLEPVRPETARFRADASYLITGGLGGFGLATAKWLAANGARHLALAGRSGTVTAEAQAAVQALRSEGIEVVVAQVDVTQEDQVARLLAVIRTSLPPLRGVIHSVLVMDDGILLHLNRDRLVKVLAPKIAGAWHLHKHTAGLPLDFFVCFSSLTSMLGMAGQGSYAAANAFLDALAFFRRAQGLPGLTVNWGPLAEVGWLARHPEVNERVLRQGVKALSADAALEALGYLLTMDRAQVGVVDIDWRQWTRHASTGALSPRLKELAPGPEVHWQAGSGEDFRAAFASVPPEDRTRLVDERLRTHLAAVLGTTVAKLDANKPITALGLDSLMAVELQVRIQRDVGTNIPLMTLLQKQSLTDLSARLAEQLDSRNGRGAVEVAWPTRDHTCSWQSDSNRISGVR